MRRSTRISTLALLGLFSGLIPAADAFGGHGRGTYHYNGSYGYWSGGGYAGCATYYPVQTASYVQQPAYYAPNPAYAVPQNAVYAQPRTTWRPSSARR